MESEVLKIVGSIAGIGGLSLGMIVILFREIIRKNIFPNLTKDQGYRILRLIAILSWALGVTGVVAWVYVRTVEPKHEKNETQYRFHGRVLDSVTQKPMSGVKVVMESAGLPRTVYTDSDGSFHFNLSNRQPQSIARFRFEVNGYEVYERLVEIEESGSLIDIRLTPKKEDPIDGSSNVEVELRELQEKIARIEAVTNRDRRENEYLKDLSAIVANMINLIRAIGEMQMELRGNISLTPEGLRSREQSIEDLQNPINVISSYAEVVEANLPGGGASSSTPPQSSIVERLEALRQENMRLQRELNLAQRFVATSDLDALKDLFKPVEGDFTIGVIRSPNGSRIYSKAEIDQFLRDAGSAANSGAPLGLFTGKAVAGGSFCVFPPTNCGGIDIGDRNNGEMNNVKWQVQWYSGTPLSMADAALARAKRLRIDLSQYLVNETACSLYSLLGQVHPRSLSLTLGPNRMIQIPRRPATPGLSREMLRDFRAWLWDRSELSSQRQHATVG